MSPQGYCFANCLRLYHGLCPLMYFSSWVLTHYCLIWLVSSSLRLQSSKFGIFVNLLGISVELCTIQYCWRGAEWIIWCWALALLHQKRPQQLQYCLSAGFSTSTGEERTPRPRFNVKLVPSLSFWFNSIVCFSGFTAVNCFCTQ